MNRTPPIIGGATPPGVPTDRQIAMQALTEARQVGEAHMALVRAVQQQGTAGAGLQLQLARTLHLLGALHGFLDSRVFPVLPDGEAVRAAFHRQQESIARGFRMEDDTREGGAYLGSLDKAVIVGWSAEVQREEVVALVDDDVTIQPAGEAPRKAALAFVVVDPRSPLHAEFDATTWHGADKGRALRVVNAKVTAAKERARKAGAYDALLSEMQGIGKRPAGDAPLPDDGHPRNPVVDDDRIPGNGGGRPLVVVK